MKVLRTISTRRLTVLIVALTAVIVTGTAIAIAGVATGPVPPAKPLAKALHDAAAAPPVQGITARVTFTNHLIDSSSIQGSDPILKGATGRLWLSSDHRVRIELQAGSGDAQAVLNNGSFWVYDPSMNTVYRGQLPKSWHKHPAEVKPGGLPSVASIEADLSQFMQDANLSGALPSNVAGRPAYTVRVSPKHDGGLLGSAALAWDALRGVPLRFAIFARGSSTPVLELKATDISYGPVPASAFTASPPSGAKVVNLSVPTNADAKSGAGERWLGQRGKHGVRVTGAAAVARRLRFTLVSPPQLVGLPQQSVRLLDWGGSPAALVTYGQNLGGIAVIEQPASSTKAAAVSGKDFHRGGLSLPTVSIKGVSGQELDTALGTMVRFTRAGVTYTVLGSVPPAAAEAAARQL